MNHAHVQEVLHTAQNAFTSWRNTPISARVQLLRSVADYYAQHQDDIAIGMAEDMGKPVAQGRGEAAICESIFRYYADNAEHLLQPDSVDGPDALEARVELHPTGVILAIMPWNYPHYQLARVIAPNLLLGNTVVFKHASICRRSAKQIEDMIRVSGGQDGLVVDSRFNHEEVYAAIGHDLVSGVTFTGGEQGGQMIGEAAGKHLKKSVLELGGNDPFIVFGVADTERVEQLAQLAARQRLANGGQTCTSPKRVIVDRTHFETFVEAYKREFLAAVPGDPLDDSTVLGPLSSEQAANELREHLRGAVSDKFQVLGELEKLNDAGRDLSPYMIIEPDRLHPLWHTELFGPVTMFVSAETVDDAIDIANDSPYGLGATVFSDNDEYVREFSTRLEFGMIGLNTTRGTSPAFPFGGVKRSGIGRELGSYGIREFANLKLLVEPSC